MAYRGHREGSDGDGWENVGDSCVYGEILGIRLSVEGSPGTREMDRGGLC